MGTEQVLVAIDGSPGSEDALRWAARYADRTGATLRLLTVFRYEEVVGVLGARWPVDSFEDLQLAAVERQHTVRDRILEPQKALEVEGEVIFGNPVKVLLEQAALADLLVVGRRGLGGFKGLLLGSVSQQCVSHAACPVTVVPSTAA